MTCDKHNLEHFERIMSYEFKRVKDLFSIAKHHVISAFSARRGAYHVYSEDDELVENGILDPRGPVVDSWRKFLLGACSVSLFLDPLFFYSPVVEGSFIKESKPLKVVLTVIRLLVDAFYMFQIYLRFRTAYIAPSSRIFGAGELIFNAKKIASRYLARDFWFDLVAALPLPQALVWIALPILGKTQFMKQKHAIRLIIIFQFLLRLYITFMLTSRIINATGILLEKAWAGAAFNLMLFMLASHAIGSCWYILSIERQEDCWEEVCNFEGSNCQYKFPGSKRSHALWRQHFYNSTNMSNFCDPQSGLYQFGIFAEALTSGITKSKFSVKFFYSFCWGIKQLSSVGQGLQVSTYVGEICFAIVIAILGLVLFAFVIGNMQMYLQSTTIRLEQWIIQRADAEEWMRYRQLPSELKERVRRYHQYTWTATGGFDEEQILEDLPKDLRCDIKHYLYSDLVRKVPLSDEMDDHMLDAICERLKNVLYIEGSCLLLEGAPVNEMLFIIRGELESYTTNGGRTGFLNTCCLGPGDFCGEELLSWAMVPKPNVILPSSTRTVTCISDVEALALTVDDLKRVASQFRRLHWKQLRPAFRFSSHQWRTWAACFIQASWSCYKRRRASSELKDKEDVLNDPSPTSSPNSSSRLTWPATSRRSMILRVDAMKQSGTVSLD